MKKFYFFIFLFMFAGLIIVSCSDNSYNLVRKEIAEIREKIYTYQDEEKYVTFMTGKRESDYKQDGVATELIDFAVINLEFYNKDYSFNEKNVLYGVVLEGKTYKGEMLNNPYDNSFVIDLKVSVSDDISSVILDITVDGTESELELCRRDNNWAISAYDALEIACKDLKDYIKQYVYDNTLHAEAFVKVVYGDKINNEYFWYVQIVCENDTIMTEVINITTGEIVAKNIQ